MKLIVTLGSHLADGQLRYESDPGISGTAVTVDPQHLRQMLLNVNGNAIKFTPAGGRITVRGSRYGREVRIEVQDTGIGIAAADLTEVTKPFVQVSGVMQRRHGGVGIGLHVTKLLAEANGGRLEIASTPGKGSTMTIVLPSASLHSGGRRGPAVRLSGSVWEKSQNLIVRPPPRLRSTTMPAHAANACTQAANSAGGSGRLK